ncbi:sporulation and spore germination protein [Ruminiclostridium sufflavum DSM 19573]|uniref:Sporulation and spore germination protein n=1 Tax=Ruminiclostridium sufflavum DSM 19573 TaxID=1121337 RepID=A0A318Y3Y9_9FIRM|nr:GerMN domain-containing protein [Ruminiclostridium sufflavum]PYG90298.1 sporulation and spore germination protein [Ruminiclostridium sufflavum DSM 19573]
MNKVNKLKVIVGVLFGFMVILVVLLVYAKTIYTKNIDTSAATNSAADQSPGSASQQGGNSDSEGTVDLKLYFYDADDYDNPKEVTTVKVAKKLYQEDITGAINEVLAATPLKINKAVLNGKLITVDLSKEIALKFNSGSAGGITYTNILAMTVLNLPDIEEMEVTVDGTAGIEADHFSFNGKFIKDDQGKKYKFIESDKLSKELDF